MALSVESVAVSGMLGVEGFNWEVERGTVLNLIDHRLAQSFLCFIGVGEMIRLLLESMISANE
jgi:hypothetical protein